MCTSLGSAPTSRTPRPARLLALLAASTLGVSLVATTPLALQAYERSALTADVALALEGHGDPARDQAPAPGEWPGADAATIGDWQVSWRHYARFDVSWNKLSTGAAAAQPPAPGW
ncbi:MAG TPA: hypothetical protein VFR56_10410 [Actinomycetes bacterium]|nr:hypothetical protein [Actinomycetes bacterium]